MVGAIIWVVESASRTLLNQLYGSEPSHGNNHALQPLMKHQPCRAPLCLRSAEALDQDLVEARIFGADGARSGSLLHNSAVVVRHPAELCNQLACRGN
jgi:hypothetical protein